MLNRSTYVTIYLIGIVSFVGCEGDEVQPSLDINSVDMSSAEDATLTDMAVIDDMIAPRPDAASPTPDLAIPDMRASDAGSCPDERDACGVCGGSGPSTWYADTDHDGLGDPATATVQCEAPNGAVLNADDTEPDCATNDTDECGACAGPGSLNAWTDVDGDGLGDPETPLEVCEFAPGIVDNADDTEPNCATNDTDDCGDCGGGNDRQDCNLVCDGEAAIDVCGVCAGGNTDVIPGACNACNHERRLVVQWTDIVAFDGIGNHTFQAILWESGRVDYQYAEIDPIVGIAATIGYQTSSEQGASPGRVAEFAVDQPHVRIEPQADGPMIFNYADPVIWSDIRGQADVIPVGDDITETIQIGFSFPFGDRQFDELKVSGNGILIFAGRNPGYTPRALPFGLRDAFLAVYWRDLNPTVHGTVHAALIEPVCGPDCNGDEEGVAYLDACGACVGGATGQLQSEQIDCNNVCNGEAELDACNRCAGGDTGRDPLIDADCRPDLVVDVNYLRQTLILDEVTVDDDCLLQEACVTGLGDRRIIRFGTKIGNIGAGDLMLGRPGDHDPWTFDQCHNHFHYENYASHELYNVATEELLPIGVKTGFAVIDTGIYDPAIAVDGCRGYSAFNQGISAGCQDVYARSLPCQWLDITDVEDGLYDVIVTTNPNGAIAETSLDNNAARVRIELEDGVLRVIE